jgi:hypothetical protein
MLLDDHKEKSSSQVREMTDNLIANWRSLMYLDLGSPKYILYHPRETLTAPAILLD